MNKRYQYQAFNVSTGKYLHEMPELFGGWNAKKPKRGYRTAGHARVALKNLTYPNKLFLDINPNDWEIHEFEMKMVRRMPLKTQEGG